MKKTKKIIAIGGGEIGRPGYKIETLGIDKEIIKLTGKKNPKLLFIPTASGDAENYINDVKKYFGKKLGCLKIKKAREIIPRLGQQNKIFFLVLLDFAIRKAMSDSSALAFGKSDKG